MKRALYVAMALILLLAGMTGCVQKPKAENVLPANAVPRAKIHSLSVTGTGCIEVIPDMAIVNLGVNITRPTALEATESASKTIDAIKARLKALGVREEDMQTSDFSIYPDYQYNEYGQQDGVRNYNIYNMLSVKVRDITKINAIIGYGLEAGANSSYGISYSVSDATQYESETLSRAVENAKARAEILARASGKMLGEITEVSDSSTCTTTVCGAVPLASSDIVSTSSGTVQICSQVTVSFQLK